MISFPNLKVNVVFIRQKEIAWGKLKFGVDCGKIKVAQQHAQ